MTTRLNYIGVQIEVTEPALFKPKKLEDDLQDKISDIKYTEKTSVEGFSAVKLRAILKSKDIDKKVDDDDGFDDNDHNDD